MLSLLILAFLQVRSQTYCNNLGAVWGADYCDAEFFCIWSGDEEGCQDDDQAAVSATPFSGSCTGCTEETYNYNGGVYYIRYSTIKGTSLDSCSIDYAISLDVLESPVCAAATCGEVTFGTGQASCVGYCWAYGDDPSCSAVACTSTGRACCAVINSYACESYCNDPQRGTQKDCCGGPATYATTSTEACRHYAERYPLTENALRHVCLNVDTTNLTACALCSSYTECCKTYKNETASVPICNYYCTDTPTDEDCKKRQACIDSLGHVPTDAELAKCGTSVVRLSSFCVALLLGLVGFFVLGL